MSNFSCYVNIYNYSSVVLTKKESSISHGHWKKAPPSQILANSTTKVSGEMLDHKQIGKTNSEYGIHAEDNEGAAAGSEGSVTYMTPGGTQIKFHFQDPYNGKNSGNWTIQVQGTETFKIDWWGASEENDYKKGDIQDGGHPCWFNFFIYNL